MKRRLRVAASMLLVAVFLWLAPTEASAQHSGDVGAAPPPPAGPGRLAVQVVAKEDGAALEGLAIALYALGPDGMPGFTNAETDAKGAALFTGISNDPGIVYLVGARYAEIPFGERVSFVEGETEASVEIAVSTPTRSLSGIRVEEIRTRIDWMGDRLAITEIQTLSQPGDRVVQLDENARDQAITLRTLPAGAIAFETGASSIGDGLAIADGKIRFWGPLYPGEQRIEYRFDLPLAKDARRATLPIELRESAARLVVVAGTTGIEVAGADLVPSRPLAEAGDVSRLASWARGGLGAGERVDLEIRLPESREDPTLLSMPRADVWIDLDDTRLNANVEFQMVVSPGAPVRGTPEAPLLHVSLPRGAELGGVARDAEAFGLAPTADGGFDVIGPIGPGEHSLAFTYQMPSRPEGLEVDLRFPREVATLNVLIADNGLALDSGRLHRRRPFRNGTRNYLHREAFNVSPDEVVDLHVAPLAATDVPQGVSMALTVAGAAGAALFLMAPLRRMRRQATAENPRMLQIREDREAVYSAIADLEHDFETGKLDVDDYTEMRASLRAQAIDLMRSEQGAEDGHEPPPRLAEGDPSEPKDPSAESVPTASFCPSCGGRIDPAWRFCSHCGGALEPKGQPGAPA